MPPPASISIQVLPTAGNNQNNFSPPSNTVATSGQVSFSVAGAPSASVYTFLGTNTNPSTVFTSGAPPYSAPTTTPYTFLSTINGSVTLSLSSTRPLDPEAGLNGTIVVGGGGGGGGDDDDDDDGGGGGGGGGGHNPK